MKAKLIKVEDGYELFTQGFLKGSTNHGLIESLNIEEGPIRYKLSPKNCQVIERGYDLDELATAYFMQEWAWIKSSTEPYSNETVEQVKKDFVSGFQKALELMGDKKFSEEDVRMAFFHVQNEPTFDEFIQSLQQTEWDVEFEMEYVGECNGNNDNGCFQDSPGHNCGCFERKPKLDENGCLILKRTK